MLNTFLSIIPIFTLIVIGFVVKRYIITHAEFWFGADKLVYYLFFPVLLVLEITRANFTSSGVYSGLMATIGATVLIAVLLLMGQRLKPVDGPLFTSVFQGAVRYNSYVFIALSHSLFGEAGVALSGIFIAYMIIIANILCIIIMNQYGANQNKKTIRSIIMLLKNPLIVAVLVGLAFNRLNMPITGAIKQSMSYLGNAATPLSLMSVGAGLMVVMNSAKVFATLYSVGLKLLLMPLLGVVILKTTGASGLVASIALLFCTMPSAGNAYILARQMGGDSQAMASIITWSTLLSVLTIPLIFGFVQF